MVPFIAIDEAIELPAADRAVVGRSRQISRRPAMNPVAAIENLNGVALVAAIAGLLLIEETVIPLLFVPGDLLLAVGHVPQ